MKRTAALFDEIVFPGGKTKAFTLSYDDGTIHDRRLLDIVNRYGVRGTFNLNSGFLDLVDVKDGPLGSFDLSKISTDEVIPLYTGHEVAGHGLNHASPTDIGSSAFMYETIEDKANLEKITGKLVRGYAYPFGNYDDKAKDILRYAGYHYARTVEVTHDFSLPRDFLEWKATCHHNDPQLMELAENFCKDDFMAMNKQLFYVWGHSYEFALDDSWTKIEELCKYMHDHGENVWFATNIEIYDYITAYRNLEYSAEGNMIYNPAGTEISIRRGGKLYSIPPLKTVIID